MKIEYNVIKKEHDWTSEDKIKWFGYGEWVEEPDFIEFEYSGYISLIKRALMKEPFAKEEAYFGGHLCGYVKIPDSHPFFKKKEKLKDIECHGGITFNEYDEEHLLGFDCAHSGDYVPTIEFLMKKNRILEDLPAIPEELIKHFFNTVYRNVEYCINECINIIKQLIEVKENAT